MKGVGFWSALGVFVLGTAYLVTLSLGVAGAGLTKPIVDPVLAVMEALTVLSAGLLVVTMAALHYRVSADRRVYSLLALIFMALMASVTMSVHFVELTALRQTGSAGLVWPSIPYALELLAWDVLLGLSLLFGAFSLRGSGPEAYVRSGMFLVGILCLAGATGPTLADMRLQFIAVSGYAVGLPVVFLLLALMFRKTPEL
jgi:hypothetical protein